MFCFAKRGHSKSKKGKNMYAKNKGGRPALAQEKVRQKTIGVRVNQYEWDTLKQKSQELGISPAQFLRDAALKKRLPSPPAPELNRKAYAQLMHLASNINQLARSVNSGSSQLSQQYLRIFAELQSAISQVQSQLLGFEAGGGEK